MIGSPHVFPQKKPASETCLDAWSWAWSRETEGMTSGRAPSWDRYLFNKNLCQQNIGIGRKRIATCGVSPELLSFIFKKSLSSFLVSLALEAAKVGNSTRTQSRNKNRPIWGVSSGQVKTLLVWEGPRVAWICFFYLNFSLGHTTVENIPSFWMMILGWNLLHNWIDHMWEWYPYCKIMDHYISSLYESNACMM